MLLKNPINLIPTLALRLTVWYAGIFALFFLGAIIFFYMFITSAVHKHMDQDLLNEAKEFSFRLKLEGVENVKTEMILKAKIKEPKNLGVKKIFYRLMSSEGTLIGSSVESSWGFRSNASVLEKLNSGSDHFYETIWIPGPYRVLHCRIGTDKVIQVGKSMGDDETYLETFRDLFWITLVFISVLSGLVGWFIAKRALTGVEDITQTAINISCGEFNSRVPVTGRGEEIDRLAVTFNNMLEQIQKLIRGMKEITDNIAHDLRSPLTRIRGIAETTLITARGDADYELMAGHVIEESDRLLSMINTMLDISEAEVGMSKMDMSEVSISTLIADACELFQPIAEDHNIILIPIFKTDMSICADKQKLQRVISNLIDNALKYTPKGGTITVSLEQDEQGVIISISDNGIGISEKDLPYIFKRFYRCDRSRSQAGVGLGLSLAQAIVNAHGGKFSVMSVPEKGSIFSFTLPRNH